MATIARIEWKCPLCELEQIDEIDEYMGPFIFCICGGCNEGFSQEEVNAVYTELVKRE